MDAFLDVDEGEVTIIEVNTVPGMTLPRCCSTRRWRWIHRWSLQISSRTRCA